MTKWFRNSIDKLNGMSFNLFNSDGSIDQGKFVTAMRNLELLSNLGMSASVSNSSNCVSSSSKTASALHECVQTASSSHKDTDFSRIRAHGPLQWRACGTTYSKVWSVQRGLPCVLDAAEELVIV